MSCDIIIPVWNELKVTKECIDSIIKNTHYPYRLIIIDNGSDELTSEYLNTLKDETRALIIRNDRNEGFITAVNQGLEASRAPYLCIMNNDTIATERWLTEMIDIADSRKDIGLVNPSSNNLGQHIGRDSIDSYAAKLRFLKGQYIEMGACLGFSMLIKREVFKRIGYFDSVYQRGNFEETDYCRRAEREGYYCVRAKGAYVYHHMKKSFVKFKDYEESFKNNQAIYNKRWGRPERILYIVTKKHKKLFDWMENEILNKARGGNWVWLFYRDVDDLPRMREHSNVKLMHISPIFFEWNCIARILKKKKRFDSIYADDQALISGIRRFEKLHKAESTLMGG